MSLRIDRRRFLSTVPWLVGGAALGSCAGGTASRRTLETGEKTPASDCYFPLLEVEGNNYEVGRAIGKRFSAHIKNGLERRKEWFHEIRAFMEQDLSEHYTPFLQAGKRHFPEIVEELEGWADGSGVDFKDLFALNLKSELSTMMKGRKAASPGCSTLALAEGKRTILAHNEDGDMVYRDLMFLVKAKVRGKPEFTCLTYPGILCGNAPALNDSGLVLTTNFISSRSVRLGGIPRYFLSRAVLGAANSAEAIALMTNSERAFSFHYNLGSRSEKKILSVETTVDDQRVKQISGLYIHTNHLVQEGISRTPQDDEYVRQSSMSRFRALNDLANQSETGPAGMQASDLVDMLSSHLNKPYSPCRHPSGTVHGATLACVVFDLDKPGMRLYAGNPCQDNHFHMT